MPKVVALPGNSGADLTAQVALLHLHTAGVYAAFDRIEALTKTPAERVEDLPQPWAHVGDRALAERQAAAVAAPKRRKVSK